MIEDAKKEARYTYADYCSWDDGKRWELIDGVAYAMSPAPGRRHQQTIGAFFSQLHSFLKGNPCKVYMAPFDVRLNADGADDTVVQPDVLVVCNRAKLDEHGCKGAPDLIIEVVSPSSGSRDFIKKFQIYLRAGVREYWVADPQEKVVQVFMLDGNRYVGSAFEGGARIPVGVLPGCVVDLEGVFVDDY